MNLFIFLSVSVVFINAISSKDLHVKEFLELNDKDNSLSDLTYGYEDLTNYRRFVRHVEIVTESVLEHLMKEIKKRYPNSGQYNTSNILHRLRTKLRRRINKKNRKLRKKHHLQVVNNTNNVIKLP